MQGGYNKKQTKRCNVEYLWSSLKSKLHVLKEEYVPITTNSRKSWGKGTFPINHATREILKLKAKMHRKWMDAISTDEYQIAKEQYTKARNKAKSALRKAKRVYE